MAPLNRERIISNEYADLLIEYNTDLTLLNRFAEYSIHIINSIYAVVHLPVDQITNRTILQYGYSAMPSIFGPISSVSLDALGITKLRNRPNLNLRGQGTLIGIVDTGIDYTNPIFQNADHTTRILSLWDQTIVSENYPVNTYYGTEFSREQINEALQSVDPYAVVPSIDEVGHGTMVAGVAAGKEVPESNFSGAAPDADLIVVKLKLAKTYLKEFFCVPESALCYQETDITFGLQYLVEVARRFNRPIAICLALGTTQSAHDGRGTLSNYLSIIASTVGTALIIAAGNEGNAKRHYYGVVDPNIGYDTVELNVGENESGFSMELWGDTPSSYSIDILSPTGEYIPKIVASLDANREISFLFEGTIINVDYQMVESQSGDQLILLRFRNPAPGIWRFQVYGRGDLTLSFDIWLPMEHFISNRTYFIRPNQYTTIQTLATVTIPITVTAYNPENDSLYLNAGRGYTRLEMVKPDIAAPGVNVTAPTLDQGFEPVTGTSVAAALATGVSAMMLEWGILRERHTRINSVEIKKFMMRGATRSTVYEYPNREWGYGILDIYNIFDVLRKDLEINV